MAWFEYKWGADIQTWADEEEDFFFTEDSGKQLNTGEKCTFCASVRVPCAGEYLLQMEFTSGLRVTVNGKGLPDGEALRLYGLMPVCPLILEKGKQTLSLQIENPEPEALTLRFRARLLNKKGEPVRQDRILPLKTIPLPSWEDHADHVVPGKEFRPGTGAGWKSAGRFGFTKGDGVLEYSVPAFGIVTRPFISGHPRWKRNGLWHFGILPPGMSPSGSLDRNYEPGPGEKLDVDWAGVRWKRKNFTIHYSALTPGLLCETEEKTFRISDLECASGFRRAMLPVKEGIRVRSEAEGMFYDRETDGPLSENWILLFDSGSFPEVPLQLIFRHNPRKLRAERNEAGELTAIEVCFDGPADWLFLEFPMGIELSSPEEITSDWEERLAQKARLLSRIAMERPVRCEDFFHRTDNRVMVIQKFTFRHYEDDFGTEGIRFAPLPPPVSLASDHVPEVKADPRTEELDFSTKYGPLRGVPHSEYASYEMPLPETRRCFPVQPPEYAKKLHEDFEEFFQFHASAERVGNPSVNTFLYPQTIPLFTFCHLEKNDRKRLEEYVGKMLDFVMNPENTYLYTDGKRCHTWYQRTEPFTKVQYLMTYLHVSEIRRYLKDCSRAAVEGRNVPFLEIDWGNAFALHAIYHGAMLSGNWEAVRKRWDVCKGAFNYFLKMMDWPCLCAAYCENGKAWSDGTNYGGYSSFLNMAEIIGDEEAAANAAYACAKMNCGRMALFVFAQHYLSRYMGVAPWYTSKLFPEETDSHWPNLNAPREKRIGNVREQTLYNMTTEGHYPEAWKMYADYLPDELSRFLDEVEKLLPPESICGPIPKEISNAYHTSWPKMKGYLGEAEVFAYLMLCIFSHRYPILQIRKMIEEAAENHRLSREFLGSVIGGRRIPKEWTKVYLLSQVVAGTPVQLARWYGLSIGECELNKAEVIVKHEDAWLEYFPDLPVFLDGEKLQGIRDRDCIRVKIPRSGTLRWKTQE